MPPPASLTILGAGPAGYPAAFLAADLGLSVTLIEADHHLGGTCLHRGCIPSKSLLHAARLLSDAREASALGLDFAPPAIRLEALREWKESVSARLANGLAQLAKARRVSVLHAQAALASPAQLQLTGPDGTVRPRISTPSCWPPAPSRCGLGIPRRPPPPVGLHRRRWPSRKSPLPPRRGRRLYRPGTGFALCRPRLARDRRRS